MRSRVKAITAALALMAGVVQAGEHGEPRPLRYASVEVGFVEPGSRLARADDSLMTRYPSASRDTSPAEDPARDAAAGSWEMLLAGFLGAAAIARRRLS
jgi:hypothetical protein